SRSHPGNFDLFATLSINRHHLRDRRRYLEKFDQLKAKLLGEATGDYPLGLGGGAHGFFEIFDELLDLESGPLRHFPLQLAKRLDVFAIGEEKLNRTADDQDYVHH